MRKISPLISAELLNNSLMGFVCRQNAGHISPMNFSRFYRQQIEIWSGSGKILSIFLNSCTDNATRIIYLQVINFLRTTDSLLKDLTPPCFFSQENCGIKQVCQIFIQNLSTSSTQHISFDWQLLSSFRVFGFWFLVALFEAWWLICSTMALNKSFRNFFSDVFSAFLKNSWIFSFW